MTDFDELPEEEKWKLIRTEYEAGKLSMASIGRLYGVTGDSIRKRAKRGNWERDLIGTLEREVEDRLLSDDEFLPKTEEERQKIIAQRQVEIIQSHRKDIMKVRVVVNTLLDRTHNMLHNKKIDGPFIGEKESPADLIKKAADSLRHLIPLERQAFGIKEDPKPVDDKANTGVLVLPEKAPVPLVDGDDPIAEAQRQFIKDIEAQNGGGDGGS